MYENNRQETLRRLIAQLHDGKDFETVKREFEENFGSVSAEEIASLEQALIEDGLAVSEVQRLCDVHAAVFKGSIQEIHQLKDLSDIPNHPANILKRENRAVEAVVSGIRSNLANIPDANALIAINEEFAKLAEIDKHYLRKENLIFPFLEQHGITAPPKVMWGVDDEIREELKALRGYSDNDLSSFQNRTEELLTKITEMIYKEENILLPMLYENFGRDEWRRIADESGDLGYCLIEPAYPEKAPSVQNNGKKPDDATVPLEGSLRFPTGVLRQEELLGMLNTLPFDVTFVDKDDTVRYFSDGKERIFPRTKAAIGRKVSNCHPPASVAVVEKIVEDFKNGVKDHEDFWINMRGKFVYIRYFAVRDENGDYLGVIEVTQDIKPIRELEGEKRLVSD